MHSPALGAAWPRFDQVKAVALYSFLWPPATSHHPLHELLTAAISKICNSHAQSDHSFAKRSLHPPSISHHKNRMLVQQSSRFFTAQRPGISRTRLQQRSCRQQRQGGVRVQVRCCYLYHAAAQAAVGPITVLLPPHAFSPVPVDTSRLSCITWRHTTRCLPLCCPLVSWQAILETTVAEAVTQQATAFGEPQCSPRTDRTAVHVPTCADQRCLFCLHCSPRAGGRGSLQQVRGPTHGEQSSTVLAASLQPRAPCRSWHSGRRASALQQQWVKS
jgi:hypothetical protein